MWVLRLRSNSSACRVSGMTRTTRNGTRDRAPLGEAGEAGGAGDAGPGVAGAGGVAVSSARGNRANRAGEGTPAQRRMGQALAGHDPVRPAGAAPSTPAPHA